MLKQLWVKYKTFIVYILAGGVTTLVSLGSYSLCYYALGIPNVPSQIISWILAVGTAFVSNKVFVFENKGWDRAVWIPEAIRFAGARVSTGVLETLAMWLGVDGLHFHAALTKAVVSVVVTVCNYLLSKIIVFKDRS